MIRKERWPLIIAVLAVVCYANAVANGFVSDDAGIIRDNPLVHSVSGLWRAWIHSYWPEVDKAGQYRPLVIASYTFDQAVLHAGAWWVHLVNVLWHAAFCVLLYRFLSVLLAPTGALFGSAWFAVHPVHVEAISMGVGRAEVMAAVFVLLAWMAHRERRPLATLWFALALASKESGIVFLGLAVLNDVLLEPKPRRALEERRALYLTYGLVSAVYALVLQTLFAHQPFVIHAPIWDYATTGQRWLTMLRVVPEYLRLLLAPVDLRVDYSPKTIDLVTTVTPAVVFGVGLLVLVMVAVVVSWRRAPAVAFGLLWFLIAIAPVSNVLFASGIVIAERTLYLPSVGAAVVAGWIFERAIVVRPRAVVALSGALCAAFVVRSWTRTPFFHDKRRYLISWVEEQPESYRAHYAVALLYTLEKDWPHADRECWIARHFRPEDIGPYTTGAEIALNRGDTTRALVLLDSARRQSPHDYATLYDLALIRRQQGRYPAAMALALAAYEVSPDSVAAIDVLTGAAQRVSDFADADLAFRRALADHPGNVHLRRSYAGMLTDRGDTAAARQQLQLTGVTAVTSLFTSQKAR
ncbi:MAG TPA: tetratricopeptide repeat protein [Gemmatimonadaceae bacterium]|nr:tetratricopeptide repeat protein [Gemmatimonadaceae bacterium]